MVLEGASLLQTPAPSPQPGPHPCCHTHTVCGHQPVGVHTVQPGLRGLRVPSGCGLAVGLARGLDTLPSSVVEEARESLNPAGSEGREERLPREPWDAVGTGAVGTV